MAPTSTKPNLNGTAHVNGTSGEEFHTLIRHPLYYIQSADLFFLLRNVQFRVHRYFFERESAWYRAKLAAPSSPGTPKLGSSDSEPIVFSDVAPADFEKLLWVFYNPHYSLYPAPASTWSSILALSHKWGFSEVKDFCVRELQLKSVEELGDIDRIVVYHDNDVDRNLLIPVYAALCAREQPLTLPEGLKLGMETTLVIAAAREYVRSQVMEDGSRTPITPTVEGEEMEKIIRDFFGIPIPEVSSASSDEVHAVAPALGALSINATSEDREPRPQLNVQTTNEPSGARAPNVRPPSPPQPLLPQPDPSPMEAPLASTAQPIKKSSKKTPKKSKQQQQQQAPKKKEEAQVPTEQPSVLMEPPVSMDPPNSIQQNEQPRQMEEPVEQRNHPDQSLPLLTSNLTQEADPTLQHEKQPDETSLLGEEVKMERGGMDGPGGKEDVGETKEVVVEAEKAEEGEMDGKKVEEVKDEESKDEVQHVDATEHTNPDTTITTTSSAAEHPDTIPVTQCEEANADANSNEETEQKPEEVAQPHTPVPPVDTEQQNSTVDATQEEEANATKDRPQDEPAPPAADSGADLATTTSTEAEVKPELPPLDASSTPAASPVVAITPLLDSPRPDSPKVSKKKKKAAKKAAAAEPEATPAEAILAVVQDPVPEPTVPAPSPERPKTPPAEAPASPVQRLKLNLEKTTFVPENSDVGTPMTEMSRPGTPKVRLSKKQRKAMAELAKKAAAEKAEQDASTGVQAPPASVEEQVGDVKDPADQEGKQRLSDEPARSPTYPSASQPTEQVEASTGASTEKEVGELVDAAGSEAAPLEPSATSTQTEGGLSMSTSISSPLDQTAEADASKPGDAAHTQDGEKDDGEKERLIDWEKDTNPEDAWFIAESDNKNGEQQKSDIDATHANESSTSSATVPPGAETPTRDVAQEPFHNLPPKPSDDDAELIPLAAQRSRDSFEAGARGHRARVNSNSSLNQKSRPPSWPAPPSSPGTHYSPTSSRSPSYSTPPSATSAGRASLSDRMTKSVKGANVAQKVQQLNKKPDEPLVDLGSATKKFKSWFG